VLNAIFRGKLWFGETLSYLMARYDFIEERTIATFRYVDPDPKNANTFAYEYGSILRDAGSAFASTLDRFVSEGSTSSKEYSILDYRKFLTASVPNISSVCLRLRYARSAVFLRPFTALEDEKERMAWWNAYNQIKHSEIDMLQEGNLVNSLNGVASLAVLYALIDGRNGVTISLFDEIGFVTPEDWVAL
jgi:hypothetical protein